MSRMGPKPGLGELFHRVGVRSGFHSGLSASVACFQLSKQWLRAPHGLGAPPSCASVGRPGTDCRPAGLQKLQGENDPYPGHHLTQNPWSLFLLHYLLSSNPQPQSCTASELHSPRAVSQGSPLVLDFAPSSLTSALSLFLMQLSPICCPLPLWW